MNLTITDPGSLTTVQDHGRVGLAHLGVPRAGALDPPAADLANRLVGNDEAAAVLESTLTGLTLELGPGPGRTRGEGRWIAVTGAVCRVAVDGRAVARAEPVWAAAGARVEVGPASSGVRSFLAISGGIDVTPVLGSRATDTLAWVGPGALAAGDVLPLGQPVGPPRAVEVSRPEVSRPLRVAPGPRVDWFAQDVLMRLCAAAYVVAPESNRVGLRLHGPALERVRHEELPSEGMVLGAVQVPPSGQPVVFLADHPITGGYPVVGVVRTADLPVCAQLRPGEQVRFTPDRGGPR